MRRIFRRDFKGYRGTEGRGRMKNRILLLIWFILLALAVHLYWSCICRPVAFICPCGSGFFAAWFLLWKKGHHEAKAPQSCGTGWIWKGKLQIVNDSVLPVFLGKGSLHLENHLPGSRWSSVFVSLKEEGKKPLTSREKASGAAVFTPPYTPGAPMIFSVS